MSLSFGAPAVLALAALLALPWLAHLTRIQRKNRRAFGAMFVLRRIESDARRHRRVDDRWLMVLRMMMVGCVVGAGAAPVFRVPDPDPDVGRSDRVVVVVDRSLSMAWTDGSQSTFERAKSQAREVVGALPDGVNVAVLAFDDRVDGTSEGWLADAARAQDAIDALQQGWGASDLRLALLEARRMLADGPGEILVFSDESGPEILRDAADQVERIVAEGHALIPFAIGGRRDNVAVVSVDVTEGVDGARAAIGLRNFGQVAREVRCTVAVGGGRVIPLFANAAPRSKVELVASLPRDVDGEVGWVECEPDGLSADDVRAFALPQSSSAHVLIVDGDAGDTPVGAESHFVERAVESWGDARTTIVSPESWADTSLDNVTSVVLANVATPPTVEQFLPFVQRGGTLWVAMGSEVVPERFNAALGPLLPATLGVPGILAARDERGRPIVPHGGRNAADFLSPTLRAGLQSVRNHRQVDATPVEGAISLAHAADGGLALAVVRVGAGHVWLWTSTLDHAWSNLPLESVFVPLIHRILGAGRAAPVQLVRAGSSVHVPLENVHEDVRVRSGDETLSFQRTDRGVRWRPPTPGVYTIETRAGEIVARAGAHVVDGESDLLAEGSMAKIERSFESTRLTRSTPLATPLLGLALLLGLAQALMARQTRPS